MLKLLIALLIPVTVVAEEQLPIPIVPNDSYNKLERQILNHTLTEYTEARTDQIAIENEVIIRHVAPDPVYDIHKSNNQRNAESFAAGTAQGLIRWPLASRK